jgi:periplasmic divalent cation tolerance protein
MTDVVLILTTVPVGDAGETLARTLIDERLAACVNLQAPMTSFYRWKGVVERDVERLVIIKTTREQIVPLRERLGQLHPYELPEFVVIEVADGSPGYLDWVRESTAPQHLIP